MEIQYLLADPTKNITVLVTTPVSRALQPELASLLLDLEPEAEQVGFVETAADGQMRLQMMGGEFCGNATMSFGAWLCRRAPIGQTCRLALEISGAPALVECSITPLDGCFLGTVDMPLPEKIETLRLPLGSETAELSVVRLPGISHIIVPAQVLTRARAEELIRRWAEVLHADALGILLLQEEELCFDPLVHVTQTDTAVWERGCGSGSAASGAYLTKKHGAPQCVSIRQPGGAIAVTTRCAEDGALSSLTISGTVLLGRSKKADVTL